MQGLGSRVGEGRGSISKRCFGTSPLDSMLATSSRKLSSTISVSWFSGFRPGSYLSRPRNTKGVLFGLKRAVREPKP